MISLFTNKYVLFFAIIIGVLIIVHLGSPFVKKMEGMDTWSAETETQFFQKYTENNKAGIKMSPDDVKKMDARERTNLETAYITEDEAKYYIQNGKFQYDPQFNQALMDDAASTIPTFATNTVSVSSTPHARLLRDSSMNKPHCKLDGDGQLTSDGMIRRDDKGVESPVANEDLPSEMKGFKFVNGQCNPCDLVTLRPKFDCPFEVGDAEGKPLPMWHVLQYFWKLGDYSSSSSNPEDKGTALYSW